MEFKGTPAPWYVEDNGVYFDVRECNNYRLIADICGSQISYDECVHSNHGIANANARLIAAAPELLEALIEIRKLVSHHDKADLAIAKALGQQ